MIYEIRTDVKGWDEIEDRPDTSTDLKLFIKEDDIDYITTNYVHGYGLTIVLKNPIKLVDFEEPLKEIELLGPNWYFREFKEVKYKDWNL